MGWSSISSFSSSLCQIATSDGAGTWFSLFCSLEGVGVRMCIWFGGEQGGVAAVMSDAIS